MPGHSVPLAALGGGILLVCFLAFNGGSQVSFIALIFKIERSIEKYYLYLK
jgi:ammonia channel protein AmtB